MTLLAKLMSLRDWYQSGQSRFLFWIEVPVFIIGGTFGHHCLSFKGHWGHWAFFWLLHWNSILTVALLTSISVFPIWFFILCTTCLYYVSPSSEILFDEVKNSLRQLGSLSYKRCLC